MMRECEPALQGAASFKSAILHSSMYHRKHCRLPMLAISNPYNSYFDAIDRIAAEGFVPNDQDIVRSRQKTTGVVEFSFTAKDTVYRIIDVGGQRSERKKWMHYFDDVDLVLFLVALSEYDQALYEDGSINRLQEALELFHSICESKWFSRTAVQLVFNKTDIFREKLKHSPLETYFPDFQGEQVSGLFDERPSTIGAD